MNKIFNQMILTIMLAGCVASTVQTSMNHKKLLSKLGGGTLGALTGYGVMFELLPRIFSEAQSPRTELDRVLLNLIKTAFVGGASYLGATYAWWLQPEGKIE
jgi:hypothetical protein